MAASDSSTSTNQGDIEPDIRFAGETNFFRASYARARFRDGLEHTFRGDDGDGEGDDGDPREWIDFGTMPIGATLRFSYNFTTCEEMTWLGHKTCTWPHTVHVVLEPHNEWNEDLYRWKLSQAWVTPDWRWEWAFWQTSGLAKVPINYDALQCDEMELLMGTPSSTMSMHVRDMTLGAFLPANYSEDSLRVFRPCGARKCRILNSQVFCRAPPHWYQLLPIIPGAIVLYCCCKGFREGPAKRRAELRSASFRQYEMVGTDSVVAVAGEAEWARRRREETLVRQNGQRS